MLVFESNLFVERNDFFANYRNYTESERGNGAIFTRAGFSIAIIWWNNSIFVFDSHSRNADGYHDPNGKAILLEFCLVSSLNSYIKSFFENNTSISLETQCDLQCISVEIVEKNKTEILTKIRLKRKYVYHKSYYGKNKKQKVDLKKQYYIEHKEQYKTYYMRNNDEICKKQNQYKIDVKDVLSEKNSLYYQENIDFIREKQSQYYLEKSESVQKRMSEYKMENKFQISKVHQDYYKDNVDTFKKKIKCIMSEID